MQTVRPPAPSTVQIAGPALGRAAASGFLWLFMQSMGARIAALSSQLVLASVLPPAAFGLFGLANSVWALASACCSLGIEDILLQRSRSMPLWASAAFRTSLGGGCAGMVLMLIAAPVAARAYGEPALVGLIGVLALAMPLTALGCVPAARLRSRLDFRFFGLYGLGEVVVSQLATVLLAASHCGAYSFVVPLPLAALARTLALWRRAPAPIGGRVRRVQLLHMAGKALLIQAKRLTVEATNQGDYIILGLLTNSTVVGVYFFAFRLAVQPLQLLASNFAAVLLPALAQLRSQPRRQGRMALQAARAAAYIITPICFVQAALAGPLLHLLFGAKWHAAVPLMQIISIGLAGEATGSISAVLLISRGEFRRDLLYLLWFTIPYFLLVGTGAWLRLATGAAIAEAVYFGLLKPVKFYWILRGDFRPADVLHIYLAPPLIAGGAVAAAFVAAHSPALPQAPLAQLAVTGLGAACLYLAMLRLLVPAMLAEIIDRLPFDPARLWRRLPARR